MESPERQISQLWKTEDWWAVWLAFALFAFASCIPRVPKPGTWVANPAEGLPLDLVGPLLLLMVGLGALVLISLMAMKAEPWRFLVAFPVVFIVTVFSHLIAGQETIKAYGLGYAFWALLVGLLVSNTVGIPDWLRAAVKTELYIKIGLVLLGGEILFTKMLALGAQGLVVAWVVTPVVIVFMYLFGTRWLKMTSKSLVIVIAAATSVCGVSAAIAAAGACRAKKEELTTAVGMTLIFTVLMMVLMPLGIKWLAMDTAVGAAWMGGTIDATGAVVAAGTMLGKEAMNIAAVVKMIQNVLIGLVAFVIAVLWVTRVERDPDGPRPSAMEIWYRFPKFIVGFVAASLLFSFVLTPTIGDEAVGTLLKVSKGFRSCFFCMAFVSIGLDSNFMDLGKQMRGGKPLLLYVVGQSFNLVLTLVMAYLAFGGILFPKPV
ncbi:YeiH family protein [Candidatus Latescibacterota bacterium]